MGSEVCQKCKGPKTSKDARCLPCRRARQRAHYAKNRDRIRTYQQKHRAKDRAKVNTYAREWRAKNYAHRQDLERRYKFGLPLGVYAAMLRAQGGVCAVCRQPERAKRNRKAKALAVDHDHDTGAVRGLLCSRCNIAIGLLDDSQARLIDAARYLAKL